MRIDGLINYLRRCVKDGKPPMVSPSDARLLVKHYDAMVEQIKAKKMLCAPDRQEHNCGLSDDVYRRIGMWLSSGDTGISSETMVAVFLGANKLEDSDAPYDSSDFGRCYRLIKIVPEIKNAFPHIAELVPAFDGILKEWDALCDLYERESPENQDVKLSWYINRLRYKYDKAQAEVMEAS